MQDSLSQPSARERPPRSAGLCCEFCAVGTITAHKVCLEETWEITVGEGADGHAQCAPQHLICSLSGIVAMVTVWTMQVSRGLNYFLCKIILQCLFHTQQCVAVSEDRTWDSLVLCESLMVTSSSIRLTPAPAEVRDFSPLCSLSIAHTLQVRFAGRQSSRLVGLC